LALLARFIYQRGLFRRADAHHDPERRDGLADKIRTSRVRALFVISHDDTFERWRSITARRKGEGGSRVEERLTMLTPGATSSRLKHKA
jgi:hypothetical protein